jgi:Flp pilus assembly pilin Flp
MCVGWIAPIQLAHVVFYKSSMCATVVRLLRDTNGQDLVEYALLTALIGFAGLLALDLLLTAIGTTYGSNESAIDSLWQPPAPGAGS